MRNPFTKMHGCGNDFVVFDHRADPCAFTPDQVVALSDRRTGIGCDQFVQLLPDDAGADLFMRIWNPDGSEAGACGNATRCVAALMRARTGRAALVIRTVSGLLPTLAQPDGLVSVNMGPARLDWRDIPLAAPADTLHLPLPGDPAALSMGNPHATFFVDDVAAYPVERLGPALEHDKLFPERANIGFAQVLAPGRIRLRVWERGAGLTRACGSGACAALVNAHRRGLTGRKAEVIVDGGALEIEWRPDGAVLMTGPATVAFTGTVDLPDHSQTGP